MVLIFIGMTQALPQDSDTVFLYGFLEGRYHLIGKAPDSDTTYSGTVVLERSADHLRVARTIHGKTIENTGIIATATADKIKVLRVEFTRNHQLYEATYLIHSDLDNYARLTGYLYLKNGKTEPPGLEALFIDLSNPEIR